MDLLVSPATTALSPSPPARRRPVSTAVPELRRPRETAREAWGIGDELVHRWPPVTVRCGNRSRCPMHSLDSTSDMEATPPAAAAVCGRPLGTDSSGAVGAALDLFQGQVQRLSRERSVLREQLQRKAAVAKEYSAELAAAEAKLRVARERAEAADEELDDTSDQVAILSHEVRTLSDKLSRIQSRLQRLNVEAEAARNAAVHPMERARREAWMLMLLRSTKRSIQRTVFLLLRRNTVLARRRREMTTQAGAISRGSDKNLRRRYFAILRRHAALGRVYRRRRVQIDLLWRSTGFGLLSTAWSKLSRWCASCQRRRHLRNHAEAFSSMSNLGLLRVYWRRLHDSAVLAARRQERRNRAHLLVRCTDTGLRRIIWQRLLANSRTHSRRRRLRGQADLMAGATHAGVRRRFFRVWLRLGDAAVRRQQRYQRAEAFLLRFNRILLTSYFSMCQRFVKRVRLRKAQNTRATALRRLQCGVLLRHFFGRFVLWTLRRRQRRLEFYVGRGATERKAVCDTEHTLRISLVSTEIGRRATLERRLHRETKPLGTTGSVGFTVGTGGMPNVIIVRQVAIGGPGSLAGLRSGDMLLEVRNPRGQFLVTSLEHFQELVGPQSYVFEGSVIRMKVTREKEIPRLDRNKARLSPGRPRRQRLSTVVDPEEDEVLDLELVVGPLAPAARATRMRQLEKAKLREFGDTFEAVRAFSFIHDPAACRQQLHAAFSEVAALGSLAARDFGKVVWTTANSLGVPPPTSDLWDGAVEDITDAEGPGEVMLSFAECFRYLRELFVNHINADAIPLLPQPMTPTRSPVLRSMSPSSGPLSPRSPPNSVRPH